MWFRFGTAFGTNGNGLQAFDTTVGKLFVFSLSFIVGYGSVWSLGYCLDGDKAFNIWLVRVTRNCLAWAFYELYGLSTAMNS